METKNTGLYILILTAGIIIISSLVDTIIENDTVEYCGTESTSQAWYCGTVATGINGEVIEFDSLNSEQQEIVAQGKDLFEGNCVQCHSIHKKVVGPALVGLSNRWENEEELIQFIKYPEQMIEKNEYAKSLYAEYQQIMPNHDFFEDEQIKSILLYIGYQSGEKVYVEL